MTKLDSMMMTIVDLEADGDVVEELVGEVVLVEVKVVALEVEVMVEALELGVVLVVVVVALVMEEEVVLEVGQVKEEVLELGEV